MGNLGSVVDELLAVDVAELPDAAVGELLADVHRQVNRLHAAYLSLLESFDRRGAATAEAGSTRAWLSQTLHVAPTTASRDIGLARDLADMLPATKAALADGDISLAHAQVIASLHPSLDAEVVRTVDPHLADAARSHTPTELRGWVSHVKQAYAPDKTTRDEQDDYAARKLNASTTIHGLGVGDFVLPGPMHEILMTAIHALSKPVDGDDRTPAQRRADALVRMAQLALGTGELPTAGGVKPHVSVIVRLDTLHQTPGAPAARYGHGATSGAHWARRLCCDAGVSRILTDATGAVLDAGRTVRTFTAAQLRAITARDQHCIWPGCDAPPAWCEGHHRKHWADGGDTSIDNGVLICDRHHDRVHLHGHAIIATPTGTYTIDLRPGSDPTWKGPRNKAGP